MISTEDWASEANASDYRSVSKKAFIVQKRMILAPMRKAGTVSLHRTGPSRGFPNSFSFSPQVPALPHNFVSNCGSMAAAMDSKQLIDAQFDRAVQIVQSLPKTGPIQTGYEEKLAMYRCVLRLQLL